MITNKSEVQKKLTEKVTMPCSRCGSNEFVILDGYSKIILDDKADKTVRLTGGRNMVPAIIVVCTKCGAITMHALGALGLLNNQGDENGKQ